MSSPYYITEITIGNIEADVSLPTFTVTESFNPSQGSNLPAYNGDYYLDQETILVPQTVAIPAAPPVPSTPPVPKTQLIKNVYFPRAWDDTPSSADSSKLIYMTPLIVPNQSSPVNMNIKVAGIPPEWWEEPLDVSIWFGTKEKSGTFLGVQSVIGFYSPGSTIWEFIMTLNGNTDVFSSFGGQVDLLLQPPNSGPKYLIAQYMIEIYCVQPLLPPGFGSGIPLQLLRLFLGPRNKFSLYTEEEWQNAVAGVIFGSLEPETLAPKTEDQYTDHWLKYDMISGGDNFRHTISGGYQDILAAWLNCYRAWRDTYHKYYANVNCYDQADMVELALSLGIRYTRTVLEYYQPFGFIDTCLVGWGQVNSPYFGGDLSQRKITASNGAYFDLKTSIPLAQTPENPKFPAQRTQFRNHQYVAVLPPNCNRPSDLPSAGLNILKSSENISGFADRVIIDACAGPFICKTVKDYYSNVKSCIKPDDDTHSYEPMQKWETRTNTDFFNGTDVPIETIKDQYSKFFDRKQFDVSFANIQAQAKTLNGIYQGQLSDLVEAFKAAFQKYKVQVTLPGVGGQNPDYVSQTVTPKSDEAGTSARFETRAWQPGKASHTYISCAFIFCNTLDTALSYLQHKLQDIAQPQSWETKHIGLWGQQQDTGSTDIWVLGSEYLKLFVVKNVLVELRTMAAWSGANTMEAGSVTDFQQGNTKLVATNALNNIAKAILTKMESADTATTSNGWIQSFINTPGIPTNLNT